MNTPFRLGLEIVFGVAAGMSFCGAAQAQIDWHRLDPWRGNQRPAPTPRPPSQPFVPSPRSDPPPTAPPPPAPTPEEIAERERKAEAIEQNDQGNAAFVKRDWGNAESFYKESLKRNPGDPVVIQNLANAQNHRGVDAYRSGDYATALYDFQQALATDPANQMVRQNIENAQRQIEEARNEALRAAEQRRQDKLAAAAIQQSIDTYERTLGGVPALEGFDFDYRSTPRTLIPDYTYRPPASAAEAERRIASLDAQISATQRQLQSLGFSQRAEDFNRLGELSSEQMKEVQKHVNSLVGDLAKAGGEEALLKSVEHIKPEYVGAFLRRLDHLGMKDTHVFKAIKDFARSTPRQQLAENATFLVKYIHKGCDLKEVVDGFYDGKRQEVGMTLISLLTGNSIGVALYDGADAGLTLSILTQDQQHLDRITDAQLGSLKATTARMKLIVDERNDLRKDLQTLRAKGPP
jgi:hypothetical protein